MAVTGRPRSFDDTEVIAHAKEIFWRRGYVGTSMRDLSDELGVLPGSLHAAFGGKRALFLRALDRYAEDAREAAADLRKPRSALLAIRQMLTDTLEGARSTPGRGCMLGNTATEMLPTDDDARRSVQRAFADLETGLEEALSRAREAGDVRADLDCGAHARLLLALLQGLHITARVERDPSRLTDAIDAALAAVSTR